MPFPSRMPHNIEQSLKMDTCLCMALIKWALESITRNKAGGGDEIPTKLSQILKDDAVKVLHSILQQIWKTEQWPQNWIRSVFTPIPKKGNVKEHSNYRIIALISHDCKVVLKRFKLDLEKVEELEIKLPTSAGS